MTVPNQTPQIERPCIGCNKPTTGSVGAAGIKWPMLCQVCKDEADQALMRKCQHEAKLLDKVVDAMFAAVVRPADSVLQANLDAACGGKAPMTVAQIRAKVREQVGANRPLAILGPGGDFCREVAP